MPQQADTVSAVHLGDAHDDVPDTLPCIFNLKLKELKTDVLLKDINIVQCSKNEVFHTAAS
jgi:hypothetical protein